MVRQSLTALAAILCLIVVGCTQAPPATPPAGPTTESSTVTTSDAPDPVAETTDSDATDTDTTDTDTTDTDATDTDAPDTDTTSTTSADAAWGTITGQFVFDGDAPEPAPIVPDKDRAVCGKHKLINESLLVDPESKGIANICVWLYLKSDEEAPEPHPSYAEGLKEPVVLDNKNCAFVPHIAFVQTGQPLKINNSDPIGHNVKGDSFQNGSFNENLPSGASITKTFDKRESLTMSTSCSIHPWMKSYVFIQDHPYVAISDKQGKFTLANLPAGEWTLRVWHERHYIDAVTLNGKSEKWPKGRLTIEVKGDQDLGVVKVDPSILEE